MENKFHISGRRWFQKTCGNTYHSVTISGLPKTAEFPGGTHYIGFTYGYENQYIQTACKWLHENGFIPTDKIGDFWNAGHTYEVTDVARKADL